MDDDRPCLELMNISGNIIGDAKYINPTTGSDDNMNIKTDRQVDGWISRQIDKTF